MTKPQLQVVSHRSRNVNLVLHINTEDVAVTRQLVQAGTLLGVDVLDHLVIGHGRWISLRERRLGFGS